MEFDRSFAIDIQKPLPSIDSRIVRGVLAVTILGAGVAYKINSEARETGNLPGNQEGLVTILQNAENDPNFGDTVIDYLASSLVTKTVGVVNPDNYHHSVVLSGPAEELPFRPSSQNGPSQRFEIELPNSYAQPDQELVIRGPIPLEPILDRGVVRMFDIPVPNWEDAQFDYTVGATLPARSDELLSQDYVLEETGLIDFLIYSPFPNGQRDNIFSLTWGPDSSGQTPAFVQTDMRSASERFTSLGIKPMVSLSIRSPQISTPIEQINSENVENEPLVEAIMIRSNLLFASGLTQNHQALTEYASDIMDIIDANR